MRRVGLAALLVLGIAGLATPAKADWKILRKFLDEDVRILEETEDKIVLFHHAAAGTLVVCVERNEKCDIYGELKRNRVGNPYRVWVVHEDLWRDPNRPRSEWGQCFRSPFLKILRAPPPEKLGKVTEETATAAS